MPNHRIGFHAVGAPQRRQRQLHTNQHRLDPVDADHLLAGVQHLPQRKPHLLDKHRLQLGDRRGERRLVGQQPLAHAGPLRALTRIHEHRARSAWPLMGVHHPHRRVTGRQCLQPGHRLGAITRTHRGDGLMPGAVMIDGVGHIGQRHPGALAGHPLGQHRGHRRHPRRGLARDHQRAHHRLRLRRQRVRYPGPARPPHGHWCH